MDVVGMELDNLTSVNYARAEGFSCDEQDAVSYMLNRGNGPKEIRKMAVKGSLLCIGSA